MLRTITDIQGEVLVRANRTTTDSFITDAMLADWFVQANNWASNYKKWPFTEGRASTTFASLVTQEDGWLAGEYPEGWKSDSIRTLTVGGKLVQKKAFGEFQKYLENYSSATDRIYTDFARRYYVNPNIDVSGTVTAWGQFTPYIDVTDNTATTVFSYNDEDGNDAIVEMMLSYERVREHLLDEAAVHKQNAIDMLESVWGKIAQEQYNYGPTKTDGMWERTDVVNGGFRGDILNTNQFNI